MSEAKTSFESSNIDQGFDPQNALTWPEGTPAIASAANLRKKTDFEGRFDMPAYWLFLNRTVSRRDHSDLIIRIDPYDMIAAGSYESDDQQPRYAAFNKPKPIAGKALKGLYKEPRYRIRVHVAKKGFGKFGINREIDANRTLLHETGHYKHDLEGTNFSEISSEAKERYARNFEDEHSSHSHRFIIEDEQ